MRSPVVCRLGHLAALLIGCIGTSSCGSIVDALAKDDRPIPREVERPPVKNEAVVPALIGQIDADGLFRYPAPNVAVGDMPYDTAAAQAREFLKYAQNYLWRGVAEAGRGAFIDMGKLVPCGYAQLLPSVYEPPPPAFDRVIQIWLGDHWSFPFCGERKEPEVVVRIAARRNETRYVNQSQFGPPADEAVAFSVVGVPWRWHAEHAVTPETAVNEVFDSTGVRTTRLPEIHSAKYGNRIDGIVTGGSSLCALWLVALERSVRVATRYSQRLLELSELYVADSHCPGPTGQIVLLTPWPEQPQMQEFAHAVTDPSATNGVRREVHNARFRAPVEFETVIVQR